MAAVLQFELGITQGERVELAMRNFPELAIVMSCINSIGAVVVL